jgi:hypothetical protein
MIRKGGVTDQPCGKAVYPDKGCAPASRVGTEREMAFVARGPLSATLRQSLRQAPRRKAAVHSRWCSLRANLGWIGYESAGGGS